MGNVDFLHCRNHQSTFFFTAKGTECSSSTLLRDLQPCATAKQLKGQDFSEETALVPHC